MTSLPAMLCSLLKAGSPHIHHYPPGSLEVTSSKPPSRDDGSRGAGHQNKKESPSKFALAMDLLPQRPPGISAGSQGRAGEFLTFTTCWE